MLDLDWGRRDTALELRAILGRDAAMPSARRTTLDRVHAAMPLQSDGRTCTPASAARCRAALGHDFLRLANALPARYPRGSGEKRLLDAMPLGVRR